VSGVAIMGGVEIKQVPVQGAVPPTLPGSRRELKEEWREMKREMREARRHLRGRSRGRDEDLDL